MVVDLAAGTATDGFGNTDTLIGIERVRGTDFADTIRGDANDNVLEGYEGADLLVGRAGDDRFNGGRGADTYKGGAGWDRVNYDNEDDDFGSMGIVVNLATGMGKDTFGKTETFVSIEEINGSVFSDTIIGGDGDNWLGGWNGNDIISGGGGDDGLRGDYGNDSLNGGAGDDYLEPGAGNDTVRGGLGWDRVSYADDEDASKGISVAFSDAGTATVTDWANGNDQLFSVERVRGTDFADTMTGSVGRQSFSGEGGNDILSGGDGDDDLEGGEGNDSLSGGSGDDWFDGGAGADLVDGEEGEDRVSYYWDFEDGGLAGVTVNLNTGTATDGFGNTDTLVSIENVDGTDQNDRLTGNADENDLIGYSGNDTLIGGEGNDYLEGGDGDDRLDASGNGEIWGDYIRPGLGANTIIGSQSLFEFGEDGIDISYADLRNVGGLTITVGASGMGTTTSGIAGLVNDTFTYAHYFEGSQDNDVIQSIDEAADTFRFEGFTGHDGADTIIGGDNGSDLIDYRNELYENPTGGSVVVNLTSGKATDTYGKIDTLVGIEEVRGTFLADRFKGTEDPNQVYSYFEGLGGADRIIGTAGYEIIGYRQDFNEGGTQGIVADLVAGTVKDGFGAIDIVSGIEAVDGTRQGDWIRGDAADNWFRGREGNDTLIGGGGADELEGGEGNDTLQGGGGDDTLLGGDGDDRLGGGTGNDFLEGGLGADQFVFNTGGGDDYVEDFEDGFDLIRIGTGAESFSDIELSEVGSDTVITFSDVSITLAGISQTQITSSDFLFV